MSTEFFNDQWRIPSNENQNKISNYSMEFDGTSDFVTISNPTSLPNNFTWSAWIYPTRVDDGYEMIYTQGTTFASVPPYFAVKDTRLHVYLTGTYETGLNFITANEWQHVALTRTNGVLNLYRNGVEYNGLRPTQNGTINNNSAGIIGKWNSNTHYFQGKIDQFCIFDYALSQDQVKILGGYGYAFNFNGSSQSVDFGNSSDFNFGSASGDLPFSISGWVKPDDTIKFRFISKLGQYLIATNAGGSLIFLIFAGNGVSRIGRAPSVAITSTDWQHWAFTYDGTGSTTGTNSGMKIYINGIEASSYVDSNKNSYSKMVSNTQPLVASYSDYAEGKMSNIQIFNSVIPPTGSNSVQTIYNNGKPLSNMSGFTSLQGWWKLDDTATFNSGTSVWSIPDASTNSNTGASVGMDASNLVTSDINGEFVANPMATSPKPIAYYQIGDQSVDNGANYLVPNNSLSDYVFDFNTDRVDISSSGGSFLNGATKLTVSIWVNLDGSTGPVDYFQVFAGNWVNPGWQFELRFIRYGNTLGPRVQFLVRSGSSGGAAQRSFDPANVGWFNITGTWDGSLIKVYTNGAPGTATGLTGTINNSNETIELGGKTGTPYSLNGKLSNVAIWKNTALTQPEVIEVYNNGAPLNLNNFSGSAPAAWYKLNASEIFNNTSTEWSIDNNAYPSVYNSSLDFIPNDYINAGTGLGNSLGTYTGDASVSLWFKADTTISNDGLFSITAFDDVVFGNLRINIYNNELYFVSSGTGNYKTIPFTDTTSWHHLVCIFKSGDITNSKIYLDEIDQTTTDVGTFPSSLSMTGLKTIIGAYHAPANTFDGKMSNVSFFNTALSTPNVQTLYNNGTPEASISHSPVSWWKLDNTTTGLIDNGSASNNGTNNGATQYAGFVNALAGESSGMDSSNLVVSDLQQTSGFSPYALTLDASIANQLILNNGGNAILNGATSLTVSAWINPTADSGAAQNIFTNWAGNIMIRFSTLEAIQVYLNGVSPTLTGTANGTITFGEWQHIVVTYSGSEVKIYRNNILIQTGSATGTLGTSAGTDIIGNRPATTQFFNGKMSNVAVWKNSVIDVNTLYNQGVPADLTSLSPTGWWQLGSNSSFNSGVWTCLNQGTGSTSAVPANATSTATMTNDDITNGVGYSASGLGSSSIDIVGDAPYSAANGLSENMDVLDRTLDTPIRNTHSIQLGGVDEYIDFGESILHTTSPTVFSVSAWINVNDVSADMNGGLGNIIADAPAGDPTNGGFWLGYDDRNTATSPIQGIAYNIKTSGGFQRGKSNNNVISSNTWAHVALVLDGQATLYINGVPSTNRTTDDSGTLVTQSNELTIGAFDNLSFDYKGLIDEVAIFNVGLSASQVSAIYNNGTPNNILPLNPISWHRFESLTTNSGVVTTADSSGNGLTGTVENGASLSTVVP